MPQEALANFAIGAGGCGLGMKHNGRSHAERAGDDPTTTEFVDEGSQLQDGMQIDLALDTTSMKLTIASQGQDIYRCSNIPAGSRLAVGEANYTGGMVVKII